MYHVDFWHKDRNPRKEETESNFLKCVVMYGQACTLV